MDDQPLFRFDRVTLEGPRGARLAGVDGVVLGDRVTCLVGPSGAGKSTLLRLCNRLDVPTSGTVSLHGEDVESLDPLALRRRVGMVFQRPTPFAGTVVDNLHVARPELTLDDAAALLGRVGLDGGMLERPAHELSGGEAQRVCLARTLATEPEVLLMDEPTASLDGAARRVLEELTRSLAGDGVGILWVTHDLGQVRRLADDVLVIIAGRIEHAAPLASLGSAAPEAVCRFLAAGGEEDA